MRQISFQPGFKNWQHAARRALAAELAPTDVVWREQGTGETSLDLFTEDSLVNSSEAAQFRVPKAFLETAKVVALHSDYTKWSLLYRILWRLVHNEPKLLEIPTDADVVALLHSERQVQRDAYRMHQYIRFRETHLHDEPWFVAWYESDHDSLSLNEKFFTDRFSNMRWSILTPKRCMHWDGQTVTYSDGVHQSAAPKDDDVEPLWVTYYSNIFNPARVKVKAMKAQMPVRNWNNLPEAAVITPLLANAPRRVQAMIERSDQQVISPAEYSIAQPPRDADWTLLRDAAATCRACPLWKTATCTVFGEGPVNARVVFVGEQPGDSEDLSGKPFVGPAGKVLNQALQRVGFDRSQAYVTNAVKHFKWEPRGKRRIHKTPNSREIAACRPWLGAELDLIKPQLIVALGATAARSLFGSPLKILEHRGQVLDSKFGPVLVTIHPSALLRLPPGVQFEPEFEKFALDLKALCH